MVIIIISKMVIIIISKVYSIFQLCQITQTYRSE